MPINFASVKPGIDTFNANVARGDQERSREETDFRQRAAFDQAREADTGTRNAIASFYANRASAVPAAPVPTTQFPARPMPVAAPVVAAPMPADGGIGADGVSQGPVAQPVAPVPAQAPPVSPGAPVVSGSSQPVPQPTAAPAPGRGDMGALMGDLSKTPGTAQTMMHLFSTDVTSQRAAAQEERRMKAEGNKEMLAHLKDGTAVADQLVALVRSQRRMGFAARRRRVPLARFPTLVEVEYAKALTNLIESFF